MNNKKGFSLLSFLLYLMLFSLITLFSCHIITFLIIPSLSAMRKTQTIIALHIASDLFVRDIRVMRQGRPCWKLVTPHELIWNHNDCDVGWRFFNHCLERREGTYDNGWRSSHTSIIAKNVSDAVFLAEKEQEDIRGIELTITPENNKGKHIICCVSL